jgi:hypothetical protein
MPLHRQDVAPLMGLYNFKARFAKPIQDGTKRHTIRAPRKGGCEDQPGDMMYLYTGLRTRQATKILVDPQVCVRVESIVIRNVVGLRSISEVWVGPFCDSVRDNGLRQQLAIHYPEQSGLSPLDADECESLAVADGFESFAEMLSFWEGRLPFYGHIFHWRRKGE